MLSSLQDNPHAKCLRYHLILSGGIDGLRMRATAGYRQPKMTFLGVTFYTHTNTHTHTHTHTHKQQDIK